MVVLKISLNEILKLIFTFIILLCKMTQIVEFNDDLKLILNNIPRDLILKSLILVDLMDEDENIFLEWNNLVLRETNDTVFINSHIHTFSEECIFTGNKEWEHHISSKEQVSFEMLLSILKFQSLAQNVVIISSNNLILSQLHKAKNILTNIKFVFINRSSQKRISFN